VQHLTLTLTQDAFDHLKALQRKKRWDWPATFSTNCRGDIWPFATRGYTPEKEREELRAPPA
jgi:hypothetical protein